MSKSKRKLPRDTETIDLTGSDQDSFRGPSLPKISKRGSSFSSSQGRAPLPTPPSSSQPGHYAPSSSQKYRDHTPSYHQQIHGKAEREGWLASTQEQEADIGREIDLTEDFDDDVYETYQLFGILNTKIVGCRFYDGHATVGEYVRVRREPRNPYDSNAIRIDNVLRDQIGHIGRNVVAKLAPLMDSGLLLVEGALTGPKTYYDCPIGLKLFGTNDAVAGAALARRMEAVGLPIKEYNRSEQQRKKQLQEFEKQQKARRKAAATMLKKGISVIDNEGPNRYSNLGTSTGIRTDPNQNMDQLLSGTATFNPRDVQDLVNKLGAGDDVLAKMPMAEQPQELATMLLPYQKQGLEWMLGQESPEPPKDSNEMVQMWKKAGKFYTNIATNFSLNKAPVLARGGLLADDMGLGNRPSHSFRRNLLTSTGRQNHSDHLPHHGRSAQDRRANPDHSTSVGYE